MKRRFLTVLTLTAVLSLSANSGIVSLSNIVVAQTTDQTDIAQRLSELDYQGERVMVRSQFMVNSEQTDEFIDRALGVTAFTNGKNNPILYRFVQNIEQPNQFVLIEEWSNRNAISQQRNAVHAQEFYEGIAQLISEPVQTRIYQPASEPASGDGEVNRALVEAQPGATPTIDKTRDRLAQYDMVEAPFVLLVDVPVESGGAATMKDTAVRVQEATLEEPGSIRYGYYQNAEQPTSFLLFEWWREFDDMAYHVELPHFQELMKTFGAVGGDGRTVALYRPLPLP